MPYTHYLIPTDRRFWCPSQLIWAVSRLYGHIGGMEVRFYAAKNAKNCLLGFAGQRPYIIAFVAIEGTPRAPVDTLRNNMPSTPHGKADRRTSGCPAGYRGYFWGVLPRPPPPPEMAYCRTSRSLLEDPSSWHCYYGHCRDSWKFRHCFLEFFYTYICRD